MPRQVNYRRQQHERTYRKAARYSEENGGSANSGSTATSGTNGTIDAALDSLDTRVTTLENSPGGASELDDLTDVDLTTSAPSNGDVLNYDTGTSTWVPVALAGGGDMLAATYDPQAIADDAFDTDNHTSGTTNKVYTATEKTKLAGIETAADVTDEVNVTDALDGATLSDVGTPASGDLILLQDASDSNVLKTAAFSEFGGGTAPTRTTTTLSGASTDVAIPAGCTWFKMMSKTITLTDTAAGFTATLRHTGNTVSQTWTGFDTNSGAVSGGAAFIFALPTGTSRRLEAEVYGPLDSSKPTLTSGFSHGSATLWRKAYSDSAVEHDNIRFEVTSGTMSGDVEIMWFYS